MECDEKKRHVVDLNSDTKGLKKSTNRQFMAKKPTGRFSVVLTDLADNTFEMIER